MHPFEGNATIAAVATASGAGGIGVVRVSGAGVPAIAETLLGRVPAPRYAHLAALREADGTLIDRGLLLHFPAPHSYTGEDVLELQCHGSPMLLDALLRRVCELGARLAQPGEFTQRAFLNGKLDLTQAEAVADLIAARSDSAVRAAIRSLDGAFSARVADLLQALVQLRVHIEAAIDFPDEDVDFLADPAIAAQLGDVRDRVALLQAEAQRGMRLNDGLRVAIVGRPNAGKSSLLNALAGTDRAIVTPIAGTTRDVLRETVVFDGIAVDMIDTAGLRASDDPIEREGVRRARAQLKHADVALLVTESAHLYVDLNALQDLPRAPETLVVINKIDVCGHAPGVEREHERTHVWLSALTGAGLDGLRAQLRGLATGHAGESGREGAFSARRRHMEALHRVDRYLQAASVALHDQQAGELAADDLRQAQQALGEITGEFVADDLLGTIFSSFCIGK